MTEIKENQLAIIIKDSGLEKTKSEVLLEKFSDYFKIAADWERKAKELKVTDESQRVEMKMAGEGRKFLKSKRVEIEKTRKELKEDCIREGKTIEGIANILKGLIEPIENYLEEQEKFIEIRDKRRKLERKEMRIKVLESLQFDYTYTDLVNMPEDSFETLVLRLENERDARILAEKQAEEKRITEEKAEKERQEKIRIENERLKKEAKDREIHHEMERSKAEAERKKEAEKQAKIQAELRAKAEAERKEKERIESELRAKKQAEDNVRKEAEILEKERLMAEKKALKAPDKVKLLNMIDSLNLQEFIFTNPDSIAMYVNISNKFNSFKVWAKSQIDNL
jgi:hypothetical protein